MTKCTAPSLSVSVNTSNRITNSGFTYNASGDMTADGTLTFTWNAEERLTAAGGVTYTYDGDGWRVKKSNGIIHWRSLSGEILAETDLAGNNLREYIYFAGRRVARRDANGTVYYFLQDHLGSTRIIANASGGVVRDVDYYPHGTEKLVSGTVDDPHKFAGMYFDSESGLYYTWFRMYSPSLGRWLAPDPIAGDVETPGSLNRYTYVLNNPVNYVDPLGLEARCDVTLVCDTQWYYAGGSSPGVPLQTTCQVVAVACDGPGSNAGSRRGGGGAFPKDPVTDSHAKKILEEKLKDFEKSHCFDVFKKVIPGFSKASFARKAFAANWYSARTVPYANWSQNTVVGNGSGTTLNQTLPLGVDAITIHGPRQSAVLVGGDFFTDPKLSTPDAVLHESLHVVTGWGDAKIFDKFKNHGLEQRNPGSGDITDWLQNDCQ